MGKMNCKFLSPQICFESTFKKSDILMIIGILCFQFIVYMNYYFTIDFLLKFLYENTHVLNWVLYPELQCT